MKLPQKRVAVVQQGSTDVIVASKLLETSIEAMPTVFAIEFRVPNTIAQIEVALSTQRPQTEYDPPVVMTQEFADDTAPDVMIVTVKMV